MSQNTAPEENVKQMAADAATAEQPEKESTWAESIKFDELFRVKGRKPLFYPTTYPNKSGMVRMKEWLGDASHFVNKSEIECLQHFRFFKEDGSTMTITQVMDNLHNCIGEDPNIGVPANILEILVPDYDIEKFKAHHAFKLIGWYREIRSKIDKESE